MALPERSAIKIEAGVCRRIGRKLPGPGSFQNPELLEDDVLAVIDSLKLVRPVLAGHSIAGQELSSIGSRHPERVAGLIYLDAAYGYAFYDAPPTPTGLPEPPPGTPPVIAAIRDGRQKYTRVESPALAIYAVPKDFGPGFAGDAAARAAAEANDTARTEAQAKVFLTAVSSGRVVRLARANHYVFASNAGDVLKEIRDFVNYVLFPVMWS
jgi:pimeloyl-ACP methyl ester carboxylesterase